MWKCFSANLVRCDLSTREQLWEGRSGGRSSKQGSHPERALWFVTALTWPFPFGFRQQGSNAPRAASAPHIWLISAGSLLPRYKWMWALVAPGRMVLNLRKATLLQVQSVLPCNTKSTLAALFAVIISTQEGSNSSTSQLQIFCSWRPICSFSSAEKYVGKLNNASSSQEYIKKKYSNTQAFVY